MFYPVAICNVTDCNNNDSGIEVEDDESYGWGNVGFIRGVSCIECLTRTRYHTLYSNIIIVDSTELDLPE